MIPHDLREYVKEPTALVQYLYVRDNAVNAIDPFGPKTVPLFLFRRGIGHDLADVVPWISYGNTKNDATTYDERLDDFAGGFPDKAAQILKWGYSMKKQIEKIAAQGIICVYKLEILLSLFCSICFVICFLAGQANKFPLLVEASIYCAILVLVLAAMLLMNLLMNLKKRKAIHADQYIIALLLPVVVLFEVVIMYGTAHF